MNIVTILMGVGFCAYASYALLMRIQGRDEKFRKLGPMREFWGPKLGSAIHYFGYVLVPLVLGVILVFAGLRGKNIFTAFE